MIDLSTINTVCFTFGALDILIHIHKQAIIQQKSYSELIQELITPYIQNILDFKKTHNYNYKIVIMAPTPPPPGCLPHTVEIYNIFNTILAQQANSESLLFFNPFSEWVDEKGFLLPHYYSGLGAHLHPEKTQELLQKLHTFINPACAKLSNDTLKSSNIFIHQRDHAHKIRYLPLDFCKNFWIVFKIIIAINY